MDPTFDTHHVTTEDELRALAHPLRLRLLGLLRADGAATASALGKRLGESSGVTSYHLRYLADRDFVTEATELGNKRERWWQAAQKSTEWDSGDFLDSREARSAELAFRREATRFHRAMVDNWMVEEATWPREWVSAALTSDLLLRLSVEQLMELSEDYRDFIIKWTHISEANEKLVEAGGPEAEGLERVFGIMQAFPVRDINP